MPVELPKKLGRDTKWFNVVTMDDLTGVSSVLQSSIGSLLAGSEYVRLPDVGLGNVIGITREPLTGESYTEFAVELYGKMEQGLDYFVYNAITRNIYSVTPTADLNAGLGTLLIEPQIIEAPEESVIVEQSQQAHAENRLFRDRIRELNENLGELNETVLPELQTNLDTLEGYLNDPSTIPEDWEFFEGILTNEIWADTGVFFNLWADNVFGNTAMFDRVTSNIIDVDDLAANVGFIGQLFSRKIVLIFDLDRDEGGIIRSANFEDAWTNESNVITEIGNAGWAIDYTGQAVFHDGYFRGQLVVAGSGSNVPTIDDLDTEITNVTNETNIEDLRSLKEEVITRKVSVDAKFTKLNNNLDLTNPERDALITANGTFDTEHNDLVTLLDNVIASGEVTSTDRTNINNALGTYRTAFGNFFEAVEDAIDSISQKKADDSSAQALDDAKLYTDDLEGYVDGAFKDGVITEAEKEAIETYLNNLAESKEEIDEEYIRVHGNSDLTGSPKTNLENAKSNFDSAYNDLVNTINTQLSSSSPNKGAIDTAFTNFRSAKSTLRRRFEEAVDAIAQEKADRAQSNAEVFTEEELDDAAQGMGYSNFQELRDKAQTEDTIIKGGSIRTSLIEVETLVSETALIANLFSKNIELVSGGVIQGNFDGDIVDGIITNTGSTGWAIDSTGFAVLNDGVIRSGEWGSGGGNFDIGPDGIKLRAPLATVPTVEQSVAWFNPSDIRVGFVGGFDNQGIRGLFFEGRHRNIYNLTEPDGTTHGHRFFINRVFTTGTPQFEIKENDIYADVNFHYKGSLLENLIDGSDTTYDAGDGLNLSGSNVFSVDNTVVRTNSNSDLGSNTITAQDFILT